MAPILYSVAASPSCRTVLLTGKALDLEFEVKKVDLENKEQLTPEYRELNPQHQVPTMVDGDLKIGESRAIASYLVDMYSKDDSLYPKDPAKRAVVDRMLYFEMGTLSTAFQQAYRPVFFGGQSTISEEHQKKLSEVFDILQSLMTPDPYLTGSNLTIADLSVLAAVSTIEAIGYELTPWPAVSTWLEKMRTLPYYKEANQDGIEELKQWVNDHKGKE